MKRYVIVSVIKGAGGEFNNNLRKDVFKKFGAKSSTLPAHFTIKAPFESISIEEVENILSNFVKANRAARMDLKGYNHFEDRVIFMDVFMSQGGKEVHDKLIDELMKVPYLDFTKKDGKDKKFHVTITSKNIKGKFQEIWDYVNEIPCDFEDSFNNICIYKWEDYNWKLHKEYILK